MDFNEDLYSFFLFKLFNPDLLLFSLILYFFCYVVLYLHIIVSIWNFSVKINISQRNMLSEALNK
jgi:hypothetical protein